MTMKKNIPARTLNSLMVAALALPGIQKANAEAAISRPQTDFRYTRYNEGENRYHIDIYLAQLKIPLGNKVDLEVTAKQDVLSGASNAFYIPANIRNQGPDSLLVESRTGDSIRDHRREVSLKPRFFGDDYNVGIKGTLSEENDYESKTIGIEYQRNFNKQNTELTFGYSFSNDAIKAITQANGLFTIRNTDRHTKNTHRFDVNIKQDLSTTSLVGAGIEFIADKGYLDDPYKLIAIYGNATALRANTYSRLGAITLDNDHRPAYRGTLGTSVRFIQRITPLNSSVHLGYRFVKNTWDIKSHTLNVDYYQELGDSFEIVPSLRYYTQNQAYFYSMAFDIVGGSPFPAKRIFGNEHASSDYRLAQYGSITGELKFNYKFLADQSGKLTLAFGLIDRRNKYCWGKTPNPINPTNDFQTYYGSLGLSFVF